MLLFPNVRHSNGLSVHIWTPTLCASWFSTCHLRPSCPIAWCCYSLLGGKKKVILVKPPQNLNQSMTTFILGAPNYYMCREMLDLNPEEFCFCLSFTLSLIIINELYRNKQVAMLSMNNELLMTVKYQASFSNYEFLQYFSNKRCMPSGFCLGQVH